MRKRTNELLIEPYFEYKKFIATCREKEYTKKTITQLHHIIPRALGGSDSPDNLVRLSIEDHKIAHEMFAKAFDVGSYEEFVNLSAVNLLNRGIKTPQDLERHRQLYIGEKNPFFGKTHTDEVKQRLSEATKQNRAGVTYKQFYGEDRFEIEKNKRAESVRLSHLNMTEEQKIQRGQNISKSLKNRNATSHNAIPVIIEGIEYRSIKQASETLNISPYKIRKIINNENT